MSIFQISVFLENRAGQLAEITSILARNNINLRALHIAEAQDYGVLRLIVDNASRASAALRENGYVVNLTPVIAVAVPDEPGALNRVLLLMAEENIDIEYMYSVFGGNNGLAYMIFRVSDPDELAEKLRARGIGIGSGAELGITD